MSLRSSQPWHLLFLMAVLLLMLTFIMDDYTIDVHLHDTYLVANARSVSLILICHLLPFLLVYAFVRRPFYSFRLVRIHCLLTMVCTAILFIGTWYNGWWMPAAGTPRRYFNRDTPETMDSLVQASNVIAIIFVLLLIGHLLFLVNLGLTFIKKSQLAVNNPETHLDNP
jgi:hypothetical protein